MAGKVSESIRTNWTLQSIEKEGALYRLQYNTPDGPKTIKTKSVALTVPSYIAADILRPVSAAAADSIGGFDYPPVAAVTLSYPESAIKQDRLDAQGHLPGFGQLHPRTQGIVTLGTIYSSSLFPGRVPEGEVLLLAYIGGALNRGIKDQSDDEIIAQVDKDLRKMLVREDAPKPRKVGLRVWSRAIPQFNVGHLDQVAAAEAALAEAGMGEVFLGGQLCERCGVGQMHGVWL